MGDFLSEKWDNMDSGNGLAVDEWFGFWESEEWADDWEISVFGVSYKSLLIFLGVIPGGSIFRIVGIRDMHGKACTISKVEEMSSPRFIKTHLPIQLLPDQIWTVKPKVIYLKRNPKDVAVSYFHHSATLHGYLGNMEDFVNAFIGDFQLYSPYFDHLVDYGMVAEKLDNFLVLRFEDLKKDINSVIKRVASFLQVSIHDNQIAELNNHLKFENMKSKSQIFI